MMQAVAISSSSSARDTLPDTEYGFSSGFSAYLSKMEALILDILTCPMVQATKPTFGYFFVVQQHDILVAGIFLDVTIQLAHGHASAFDGL